MLWSRSYFVSTHGHVSSETMKYVEGAADSSMRAKFRIYPNRQQIQTLEQTIETCRLLYNESMQERRDDKGLKYYEQKRRLTQKLRLLMPKNVHSQVLQNVVLRLERAFQNHHRDLRVGQPTFKRRDRYNFYNLSSVCVFLYQGQQVKTGFVDGLSLRLHRIPRPRQYQDLYHNQRYRWFACFFCPYINRLLR